MLPDKVWEKIVNYAQSTKEKIIPLLNPNIESPFIITQMKDGYIKIDKLRDIKMTKQMFLSVFDYIKNKNGDWVRLGTNRINTKEDTVEGIIKKEFYKNNPNALSTATWFSAILVYSNIGIEFNNKAKRQKLRFKMK